MSASLLSFERVSYRYPGRDADALADVSVQVQPGEFCLLAGLSGHGKSTFLRAACGLVPHFDGGRFAGRVTLAGLDTREHGPARVGAFVGVLFQVQRQSFTDDTVHGALGFRVAQLALGLTFKLRLGQFNANNGC